MRTETFTEPVARRAVNPSLVLALVCLAQFMVVLDATIVNVALPTLQHDLHFSPSSLPVGDQLLHPGLRRLPAARREGVGSLRAQAPVPRRSRRVHGGIGARWHRAVVGIPDRGSRPAGVRRCARLAGGALDRHHHLPRGPRAHPRDGRVGGDRRRWRRGRPAARRDPDRVRVVALDLLRQRPGRSARVRVGDAASCPSRASRSVVASISSARSA